ncbi:two-component sensor histidine kinase [Bacteroidia bacterium]|nr:two-component sensor histidine kinase [Bacteroidia bacterium]
MKLINHLILRITIGFTVVMLFWGAVYFFLQMKEIHDGNDEGLTNLKQEFIAKANAVGGFVENMERETPLNLTVKEISREEAEKMVENFSTTTVYFATELEKEEVRMLTTAFRCTQNGKFYQLQFFTSTVESDDLIKNMLYLLLGLWVTLSLTIIIISKIIIFRANKPFYELLDKLKNFRLDTNKIFDFPQTEIKEYAQLNRSVEELLKKNIDIFTEQKQFIENTSHELQTPLAIVIAKLEMLLEKYQNNEYLSAEIAAALNTLNRMKRLNSNLLLLSKIKNNLFTDIAEVDLQRVLEGVVADFEEIIACKNITVVSTYSISATVRMNRDLAHILLTNLVKNAVAHNRTGGQIIISGKANSITIANSGTTAATNIFSRYQRDANDENSSGLGLSIVKSIADLYPVDINYHFENGLHTFKITF